MPLSPYDSPPLLEDKEGFRDFILKLFDDVYGLGPDKVGSLNVSENLDVNVADVSDDITITGTWTFATHPLGIDHFQISNIGGNTHVAIDSHIADATIHYTVESIDHALILVSSLLWSNAGHTIDTDIVMNDNSLTGVDTITFTDINGTIAGIENQNLLDKTATETITGSPWIFQNTADSDDSFQVLDSVGSSALNINTNNRRVSSNGRDVLSYALMAGI